ncbi:hypothetical protein BDN70DRAFT_871354 [Pholiota conissans]|uniref:PX domain-containing protein n=1 Tax=Pholiota conissans TaxID=109636 RepID=A0A9P6D689_9AGAR|nr:hypothetical protein BDN70DRAFT_871354 [Pholiota conissans]
MTSPQVAPVEDGQATSQDDVDQHRRDTPSDLTPLRAHYLKKYLVQLQFTRELDLIITEGPENVSTLSYLGSPFTPLPKNAPPLDLPFLRYVFRQFVLTFPFMAAAPKDFYSLKLQPFVNAVVARNITSGSVIDDGESVQKSRKKLLAKIERNLSLFINAATKLAEPEEVVRLSQTDLDRLEILAKKRQARLAKAKDFFEVNIIGVRTVVDRGRMRSRAHEEFIIRTRRSRYPDVYTSRRYGDFRTLAAELSKAHPEEEIPLPPQKDKTFVSAPPISPTASRPPMSPSPLSRTSTTSTSATGYTTNYASDSYTRRQPSPSRLAREKNRLTLRSYLNTLLASSVIANSPVLRSFLLSGPITLTSDEMEDTRRREEADRVRDEGRKKFAKEIASRVESLRDAVKSVKGDIMGKDGLTHVFGTIKVTPNIEGLPANYQAVVEWARISLASTIFHMFVASDDASQTFAGLKRIHGLMPYFMLKTALKITNPVGMIRSVLDLFLAQPFGGRSLLQRMFTSSLTEEVKVLEEEIEAVKDKVDDPIMCAKIRQFVYAPREIQAMFKADAAVEQMNLITIVLRSSEEPVLSRVQMHRLARAHKAHLIYLKHKSSLADSDDDEGPQDEDAWLLEDLKILVQLYSRLRDREKLIELVFEGFTSELLKDIITIFYAPLAQVYRAASIADSLGDMQNFINDLIKTVEQVEELSQEDPHVTVQAFMDLVQRHEQSFYNFVHKVHSKGEGLFDSLMHWIELFLTVVRDGLGEPISLEFLLPHTGADRTNILAEVDKVAQYHYKLKVLYEDKIRRRFGRAHSNEADAEDEATQALVNGVVGEISFGDLVHGDAVDLAAEETDEEESSGEEYSSSEYETDSNDSSDETESSGDHLIHSRQGPTTSSAFVQLPAHSGGHRPHLHQNNVRTVTNHLQQISPSAGSIQMLVPAPQPQRKRSFSLKRTKSMNFSMSSLSLSSKRNQDVPPVPPLPKVSQSAHPAPTRPLPPSPPNSDTNDRSPPVARKDSVSRTDEFDSQSLQSQRPAHLPPVTIHMAPKPQTTRPSKKQTQPPLKPPELEHIPQLLPVFVEMMKPMLRVRHATSS